MESNQTYTLSLHIRASHEAVWDALTRAEAWAAYFPEWQPRSVWQSGAPLHFHQADGELYSTGQVLEADYPRYLSYTWPEPDGPFRPDLPERLTWRIESSGPGTVRLAFVHDQLTPATLQAVSAGWPAILSSLKSYLETGQPLRFFPK